MGKQFFFIGLIVFLFSISSCTKESNAPSEVTKTEWEPVVKFAGKYVSDIATSGSSVFVITANDSLCRLKDNDTSWTTLNLKAHSFYPLLSAHDSIVVVTYPTIRLSKNNGDTWTDVTQGFIGKVRKISVNTSAFHNNILFAGMEEDGVFSSTDYGITWTAVSTGLQSPIIWTMKVRGNTMYVGALSSIVDGIYKAGGVFMTTDNGQQWTATGLVSDTTNIFSLAVSDNLLIAGTGETGVFRSTNNGVNWVRVNSELKNLNVTALTITGNIVIAGTSTGGVFISKDNGVNWEAHNLGLPQLYIDELAVHNNTLYAGTGGGLWKCSINEQ